MSYTATPQQLRLVKDARAAGLTGVQYSKSYGVVIFPTRKSFRKIYTPQRVTQELQRVKKVQASSTVRPDENATFMHPAAEAYFESIGHAAARLSQEVAHEQSRMRILHGKSIDILVEESSTHDLATHTAFSAGTLYRFKA